MITGTPLDQYVFDARTVYLHDFYTEGTYRVVGNLSNPISTGIVWAYIIVATPVVNLRWTMPVAHPSINVPFVAGIQMDMGQNVQLIWDFGDGSGTVTKPRVGECGTESALSSDLL